MPGTRIEVTLAKVKETKNTAVFSEADPATGEPFESPTVMAQHLVTVYVSKRSPFAKLDTFTALLDTE